MSPFARLTPLSAALHLAFTLVLVLAALIAAPLAAETPGKDGDATIIGTQTVNEYGRVAGSPSAGSTSISVIGLAANLPSLEAGDLIMIYQAQGASITNANNASYGTITSLNSAGRYEFQTVRSISGNTITLETYGGACAGLAFSYDVGGEPQVIRVPQYRNLTVSAGARIVGRSWDGEFGGIIAMTVAGTLTVSGTIDASQIGFRGGQVDNQTVPSGQSFFGYRSNQARNGAEKGESIAGYQGDLPGGNFYGRGAPANGGGGGNGHNAGGGGGGNGNNGNTWAGQGVPDNSNPAWTQAWNLDPTLNANTSNSGGGRGGYTFSFQNQNALVVPPGDSRWRNDFRRELGGLGGRPMDFDPNGRFFFGGGGGAGDGNNNAAGAGGRGGGIVFIQANSITGGGQILADGEDGEDTSPGHNDGPGGGGAGGTIVVQSGGAIGATLRADGGDGGTQLITNNESEGPGGGGSGGVVATTGGVSATFARGGVNGVTNSASLTEFVPNGATQGALGQPLTSAPSLAATPFCRAPDAPVEISKISRSTATSGQEAFRIPGADQTYTITFSNPGPAIDANSIVITDTLPSDIELWTGAFSGSVSSPIAFEDGSGAAATGLTCCASGVITYSDQAAGSNFTYVPNGAYDPAVRRVRINPQGAVAEGFSTARTFEIFLRARITDGQPTPP